MLGQTAGFMQQCQAVRCSCSSKACIPTHTHRVSTTNFMSPMGFSRPYMPPCSSSWRTISLVICAAT